MYRTGMQFGRKLESHFSQHYVLSNPWNLGTGGGDKTSPIEKFRDHAGFTAFVLSVLPPQTGSQQDKKPSFSAFKVTNPLPSTSDGSRWAAGPGSPYNHCWGRGIPGAGFLWAVSHAGRRKGWHELLPSAICKGRLSMPASEVVPNCHWQRT